MICVDVHELLAFYDQEITARLHANAVKTLAGEELGIALLVECFRRRGAKAELLKQPCTTGKVRGSRLDGWLKVYDKASEVYYQVAVKTWSFHGYRGGGPLKVNCTSQELSEFKRSEWQKYWADGKFYEPRLNKVLTPMNCPTSGAIVEPLACLWTALHPNGSTESLFSVPLSGSSSFKQIWVFSMSGFLVA